MKRKIKILFIIPTLTTGGAERIMTFLSRNIDKSIFDSRLVVIGPSSDIAYDISNTKIKFLNQQRVLFSIPRLIRCFFYEKPDIVFGSITHLNVTLGLISYIFPKMIFVGRQAGINKISILHNKNKSNILFNYITSIGLKKLNYIICQSEDMLKDCIEEFEINKNKLKIIHNPITDNFKLKNLKDSENSHILRFITVGRLVPIKGHERILEVLSKFKSHFTYTIIGDGPKKSAILKKVDSLGLKDNVTFINFTKEVSKYLSKSNFYLQGSYAEGFPNALLESCAVGTPVIAFEAPGGTREIVENGINGFLVKDEKAFLEQLNNLMAFDPQKVSESVYNKFAKDIILNEYETFFENIVDKRYND